jgi:DNA-binding MltR family transcriptional regulator
MSKRGDALRKLIRDVPPPADVKLILDNLDKESDRSAALVASSLLDTTLERVLRHSMTRKDRELNNQLFQQRGPLGDFYSKVIIANAFGVISEKMAAELNIIRNIRNVFAHATSSLSFETEEIAAEIKRSEILRVIQEKADDHAKGDRNFVRELPSGRAFKLLVTILFIMLDHDQKSKGGSPMSV